MDVAELGLMVDSRQLQKGQVELKKFERSAQSTDRATDRLNRQFTEMGKAAGSAGGGFARLGNAARSNTGAFRNVGLQLSQVTQQAAVTGNAFSALAIQLPDMLIGFGTFGIMAGVAAGALVPLVSNLLDTGGGVDELKQRLDDLNETLSTTGEVAKLVRSSTRELREEFGGAAWAIEDFIAARVDLSLRALADSADEASSALARMYNGSGFFNRSRREDLFAAFRFGAEDIDLLAASLGRLNRAETLEEQLEIVSALRENFQRMAGDVAQMTERELEFYSAVVDTEEALRRVLDRTTDLREEVRGIGQAATASAQGFAAIITPVDALIDKTRELAKNTYEAVGYLSILNAARDRVSSGRGGDPRDMGGSFYDWQTREGTDYLDNYTPPRANAGSRGASAASQLGQSLMEAQRLYEDTRTAAEEYAAAVARINELHAQFPEIVTEEVRDRALEELKQGFDEASKSSNRYAATFQNSFSSLIDDLIDGSGRGADAIEELGRSLLALALKMQVFQALAGMFPSVFGTGGAVPLVASSNGNVFANGSLVPFAKGGVVNQPTVFPMARGAGLMGEAGPEAVMPLTRDRRGRLGVSADGGGSKAEANVEINNYSRDEATVQRRRGPNAEEYVIVTIGDAMSRGRFDGPMNARTGVKPRAKRR
jgi:ABC-type transporter Mla subunit MlaD